MRVILAIGVWAVALLVAGCGGPDEPEKKEETMRVEDTAFGPLVGTPKKVEDRTDAAAERYRDSMNERLEEGEGAPKEEPAGD